jgi:AraC-like DNA-binding protein
LSNLPWQNLLHVIGAANAMLLAAVLAWSPRLARTRARWLLAAYLSGLGLLLWLFTAVDAGWLPFSKALRIVYDAVALLIPALLLDYLRRAVGTTPSARWTYAPAPLFLLLALFPGAAFLSWFRIEHVVLVQIGYSVAAVWLLFRTRGRLAVWPRHLVVLVGGVLLIHVTQLLRIMFPAVGWIFDAVPLVGAVYFIALTWMVFTDPRALRHFTDVVQGPSDSHDAAFSTLNEYMSRDTPYLDPKLSLESLAAAAGMSPRRLSEVINEATGSGFYEYVNGHRVTAARRLLKDAAERRTSIEAIGLMVGFRSRSTFYEAFKRETGQTPAAWRKARQA